MALFVCILSFFSFLLFFWEGGSVQFEAEQLLKKYTEKPVIYPSKINFFCDPFLSSFFFLPMFLFLPLPFSPLQETQFEDWWLSLRDALSFILQISSPKWPWVAFTVLSFFYFFYLPLFPFVSKAFVGLGIDIHVSRAQRSRLSVFSSNGVFWINWKPWQDKIVLYG